VGRFAASAKDAIVQMLLERLPEMMQEVGAVLGFPVGELRVVLVKQFAR
jgi:hypothetical protein